MPYRWVILFFGMLAYTTSYFARSNYTGIAKFVSADFGLDEGAIGLLGSVFLYTYALSQMPWGIASDRWGSRKAVGIGVLLTGVTLWGFANSSTFSQLLFWRAANGIAAAAIYVVMAGSLARWFSPKERGFAQTTFAAVGGTTGEGTANLIVPYLAINIASGWRQSTEILAALIVAIAVACVVFLRSAPPGGEATEHKPFDWSLVKSVRLWCFILVYSGSIIAIRILPPWLPIYAADIYISRGMTVSQAVIAAGILSTLYLAGRLLGPPFMGFLSDRLLVRGISRDSLAVAFLFLTAVLFQLMPLGIRSTFVLGLIAFVMGIAINMYPLITTAVSETFGPTKTSSVMGFLQTFAQFAGASALLVSGYLGTALSSAPGNALAEYRGIWLVGIAGSLGPAVLGILLSRLSSQAEILPVLAENKGEF